jgi:hypothetical protein
LDILVVVGCFALVGWAGLSLLRETDFYDAVVTAAEDAFVYWASWALALVAVAALAAVLYLLLV